MGAKYGESVSEAAKIGDPPWCLRVVGAGDNRNKSKKERNEGMYVKLTGEGRAQEMRAEVNDTIWPFFARHPRDKK